MATHIVEIPDGHALVTLLVPKGISQMQVNQVMTKAAATLAELNGMNCQRIADPQYLGYRVFPMESKPNPAPPKVVSLDERRKALGHSFRLNPFTPPSAA
jgi:hypothetical protein